MAYSKKGKLNYRCPCCFARDLDIDMFYDEEHDEFYCIRCSYTAKEKEILERNEALKYKYKMINRRVINFNADNEPLSSEVYHGK